MGKTKALTRQQKAANTRKANKELKLLGTKIIDKWMVSEEPPLSTEQQTLKIILPNDNTIISLSKALDNSLDKLEQRMADYIARVDRILA